MSEDRHHHIGQDYCPVADLGLDAFEVGLLAVARHFLTAWSRPETQAWQTAYAVAASNWGAARGPQIAHGLLAVMQCLRQARSQDFHFANPQCKGCRDHATPEEAALMLLIHAMRRDRPDLARGALLQLTEGEFDPPLIEVTMGFAQRFPADKGAALAAMRPTHTARNHLRLVH